MRVPLPLVLVALLALPVASAAPEGRIVDVDAGQSASWEAEPGVYWLFVASGEGGARLDLRGLGDDARSGDCSGASSPEGHAPTPGACEEGFSRLGPTSAQGSRISLDEGETPEVRVVEGSARALLGRVDLHEPLRTNGTHATLRAGGALAAGTCVAQHYLTSAFQGGEQPVTRGPVSFVAAAPGGSVALLDSRLRELQRADEALAWSGDPDAPSLAFVHLCAGDRATEYVVRVERTAPEESMRPVPLPALWAALALAIARRARARRAP